MRPGHTISTGLSIVIRNLVHHRLVCIAFVLVGLIGAPNVASSAPPIVDVADTGGSGGATSAETQNQHVAARLFDEVFSQRKADVCALLMSANAVNHTPSGDFVGPAGFERYVAQLWASYPDATFAVDEGVTEGDQVTLRWTLSGSAASDMGQLNGVTILRFEHNMIAESWIVHDNEAPATTGQDDVSPAPEICPPCREP